MIKLIREEFTKVGNKWQLVESEERQVDYDFYLNVIDRRFFKSLGGIERSFRTYTSKGYRITRQISISPDGQHKIVFNFEF